MIKKIHYCWFGGEKPDSVKRNVEHWARLNPDFEICEWNESNIDVANYEFGRRALNERKWGFLVDTIRPLKLVEEGGFYIDADVEMVRPLSDLSVYHADNKLQIGYIYDCALGTAVLYAPPQHPYLVDILHSYNYIREDVWPVSNSVFTAYFINNVPGFLPDGKEWTGDMCHIYPKNFFEQPSFIKSSGFCIHHCCGSWKKSFNKEFGVRTGMNVFAHLLKWASRKRRTWLASLDNEFTPCYRAALRGEHLSFDISGIYKVENPYSQK